jgi:hypothetical protein
MQCRKTICTKTTTDTIIAANVGEEKEQMTMLLITTICPMEMAVANLSQYAALNLSAANLNAALSLSVANLNAALSLSAANLNVALSLRHLAALSLSAANLNVLNLAVLVSLKDSQLALQRDAAHLQENHLALQRNVVNLQD